MNEQGGLRGGTVKRAGESREVAHST
jgi:hypothetical protein